MLQTLQFNWSDYAVDEHDSHHDCDTGAAALHHVSACLWLFKCLLCGLLMFSRCLPQLILISKAAEALIWASTQALAQVQASALNF